MTDKAKLREAQEVLQGVSQWIRSGHVRGDGKMLEVKHE